MAERGKNLSIVVCGDSESRYPRDQTILEALLRIPGVRMMDLTYRLDSGAARWFRGSRLAAAWKGMHRRMMLRRMDGLVGSGEVDAVLFMKNNPSMYTAIRKIAGRAGVPTIYDLWVSRVLSAQRDGMETSPQAMQEREIALQSEWLLATTEPYRRFYADVHGCRPDKIVVAPLAVTDAWHATPARARRPGPFVVAYWGSYLKQHGVDVALDAARLLQAENDIAFRFYGDRPTDLASLSGFAPPGNVEFMPRISQTAELIRAIDDVDLGFGHLRLIHDAHLMLPNKAMEGMARRKPIVHVSSPQLDPLYNGSDGNGASVCFYDGTAEGLAAKIRFFRDNPSVAAAIGDQARSRVTQGHSAKCLAQVFAEALPLICSRRAPNAVQGSA